MGLIRRAKGLILRSPLLRAAVSRLRDRAAAVAARLAGERRMNEAMHGRVELMELEIYRLRSDLNRAVGQEARGRERNLELRERLRASGDLQA